ncbi:hypothetical protein IPJ72_05940 [Candidatus Peregrinibacteria bacterium]|nr:MAG: hypothetical protein IPJ72_05940 [Candidatus Peregrinibacteria bacterium]
MRGDQILLVGKHFGSSDDATSADLESPPVLSGAIAIETILKERGLAGVRHTPDYEGLTSYLPEIIVGKIRYLIVVGPLQGSPVTADLHHTDDDRDSAADTTRYCLEELTALLGEEVRRQIKVVLANCSIAADPDWIARHTNYYYPRFSAEDLKVLMGRFNYVEAEALQAAGAASAQTIAGERAAQRVRAMLSHHQSLPPLKPRSPSESPSQLPIQHEAHIRLHPYKDWKVDRDLAVLSDALGVGSVVDFFRQVADFSDVPHGQKPLTLCMGPGDGSILHTLQGELSDLTHVGLADSLVHTPVTLLKAALRPSLNHKEFEGFHQIIGDRMIDRTADRHELYIGIGDELEDERFRRILLALASDEVLKKLHNKISTRFLKLNL